MKPATAMRLSDTYPAVAWPWWGLVYAVRELYARWIYDDERDSAEWFDLGGEG